MIRVGVDLVQVSRIAESLAEFGERFLRRIFTDGEIAYAQASPAHTHARLAARFAAKEAAFKALRLEQSAWRQVEVVNEASGAPALVLHGEVARAAGAAELAVSLSHEGDLATAVVISHMETR